MNILVTGGTGYIGSHTVVELLQAGYNVLILDNLQNSNISVIERIQQICAKKPKLIIGDIRNQSLLHNIFTQNKIDAIIHFAGLKSVKESLAEPSKYYENNVSGSICLFKAMANFKINKLIFSSSATVYGSKANTPYVESMSIGKGTSPYANSKIIIEQILMDLCYAYPDWSVKTLRYFNPIGAHFSGLIGEDPQGIPNNLLPYITQVAIGKLKQLYIYGDDYDTADGTCLRDYIHVVDLAKGHLAAINAFNQTGYDVFNLGTGNGVSVLEIVNEFTKINQTKIAYQIVQRRDGDLPAFWADPSKAKKKLNWEAKLTLSEMLSSAWKWEQYNKLQQKNN